MNDKLTLDKYDINTYTFNITTEGVESSELEVYFYIDLPDMRIQFKCEAEKDNYSCSVPILNFINKSTYRCGLIVYSNDGYYFEPFNGNINVVAKPKVVADVAPQNAKLTATFSGSNVTATPVKQEEEKPKDEPKKEEPKVVKNDQDDDQSLTNFIKREKENSTKPKNQDDFNIDSFLSQMDKVEKKLDKIDDKINGNSEEPKKEEPKKEEVKKDFSIDSLLDQMDKIEDKVDKIKTDVIDKKEVKEEVEETVADKNKQSVAAILEELGMKVNKSTRRPGIIPEGTRMPPSIKSKLK